MKIYVASSWKNEHQPQVVEELRKAGHEVYDFRNPTPGDHGFNWAEIDPNWQNWTKFQYENALLHWKAEAGFKSDFDAMRAADVFVGVAPFGNSASMEMGYAAGARKFTILYIPGEVGKIELMVKMFDWISNSIPNVIEAIRIYESDRVLKHEGCAK